MNNLDDKLNFTLTRMQCIDISDSIKSTMTILNNILKNEPKNPNLKARIRRLYELFILFDVSEEGSKNV